MKVSVEYVAKLARLNISEKEKELFGKQLENILDHIETLNELDTKDIEPTSHVLSLSDVMREDKPDKSLSKEDALMNAPDCTDKFYRVPKIIE
ncbi:MAG: Asp-tRNA(Asn)/Glu-tRNA(Gln) amidotransferase subunit GatC [Nitrospiraceae bacterium]|nr:Asp-tRNA(Asn)/Glu-tRNA(Gln) amidotransferase subunit GatC [Nitrospiraceae bacterium]